MDIITHSTEYFVPWTRLVSDLFSFYAVRSYRCTVFGIVLPRTKCLSRRIIKKNKINITKILTSGTYEFALLKRPLLWVNNISRPRLSAAGDLRHAESRLPKAVPANIVLQVRLAEPHDAGGILPFAVRWSGAAALDALLRDTRRTRHGATSSVTDQTGRRADHDRGRCRDQPTYNHGVRIVSLVDRFVWFSNHNLFNIT